MSTEITLRGTKIVEIPYFATQLIDNTKSVLIIGEQTGEEGLSATVREMGFTNVTTTDISPIGPDSWLDRTAKDWKHVTVDFVKYDETLKYDYIIAISVFEHFGFWFVGEHTADGVVDDYCRWEHDIRGINKACQLLKDAESKLMISLPAGPYMNYEPSGRPWLRSYDWRRQEIVKKELEKNGFRIDNEKFFYSKDFQEWNEVGPEINHPKYYHLYEVGTPNVIWGFTVSKK